MKNNIDLNEEVIEIMIGNDEGEEIPFYIVDKAVYQNKDYYLAVDNMEMDEAEEMLILMDASENEDDLVLEIVDDESLLNEISTVFEEQLEDMELEI